jgi:Flp pilus assembly protein TadD
MEKKNTQKKKKKKTHREALLHKPDYPEALCNLGVLAKHSGRPHDAVTLYERALQLNPNFEVCERNLAPALVDIATALMAQLPKDGPVSAEHPTVVEAVRVLRRALFFNPTLADAHFNLGVVHAALNEPHEAAVAYRLALHFAPKHVEAINNLGVVHRALGNLELSARYYRAALDVRPHFPQSLNNLAVIWLSRGMVTMAASLLRNAIASMPNYGEAYNNLGVVCRETGDVEKSVAAYTRCVALSSSLSQARHASQNRLLSLNYSDTAEVELVTREHETWGAAWERDAAATARETWPAAERIASQRDAETAPMDETRARRILQLGPFASVASVALGTLGASRASLHSKTLHCGDGGSGSGDGSAGSGSLSRTVAETETETETRPDRSNGGGDNSSSGSSLGPPVSNGGGSSSQSSHRNHRNNNHNNRNNNHQNNDSSTTSERSVAAGGEINGVDINDAAANLLGTNVPSSSAERVQTWLGSDAAVPTDGPAGSRVMRRGRTVSSNAVSKRSVRHRRGPDSDFCADIGDECGDLGAAAANGSTAKSRGAANDVGAGPHAGRDPSPAVSAARATASRSMSSSRTSGSFALDARIRLGLLSGDMYHHSVSYFAHVLLREYDRSKFHITVYSTCISKDDKTDALSALPDNWRTVAGLTAADLAAEITADGIHILVDLAGHTANNRLDAMALRPAPVQMTHIGYPNTTGLSRIDYRITDDIVDPMDTTQRVSVPAQAQ